MVNQEEINNKFIEIIRFLKSEYGYTQEYIVEKAKLGKSYISKIKNGENNAGDKTIAKLCDAFKQINPDFIYGRSPYKTKREEAEAKFEQTLKEVQGIEHVHSQPNRENDLKDELIAQLKKQVQDKDDQLADKERTIRLLEQKIEYLEAMQHIDADDILRSPFPVGVADDGTRKENDNMRV